MHFIIRLLVQTLAIFITAYLLSGVSVSDLYTALIVAIILGIVNTFIKPIIMLLTLPLNVLTLGLLSFVINAAMILLVDYLVQGFTISSFWWAILFGLVLSIINWILIKIVE